MDFSHLHCHTQYSLLDGAARIKTLIGKAKSLEMTALAITDHGNLYGALQFYKAAKAGGMDILDLMKEGIVQPMRVVNLRSISDLGGVRVDERGMDLGALVTLADLARHPGIENAWNEPALRAAEIGEGAARREIGGRIAIASTIPTKPLTM